MRFFMPKAARAVAIGAVAIAALGAMAVAIASADGQTVGVTSEEIALEGEGKVTLWADGFSEPGLGAWTVDIYYNADLLKVVECGAESGGVCNPEFKGNAVRITGSSADGRTGEFVLGSVWFSCKGFGESGLELDIKVLADATVGDPQPVEPKTVHGSVTCLDEKHEKVAGDANCDGEVSAVDSSWILQYDAGLLDSVPCPDQADYNGDGNINSIDSTIVLQKVAGLLD